jgi:hypothetical protein
MTYFSHYIAVIDFNRGILQAGTIRQSALCVFGTNCRNFLLS